MQRYVSDSRGLKIVTPPKSKPRKEGKETLGRQEGRALDNSCAASRGGNSSEQAEREGWKLPDASNWRTLAEGIGLDYR